MLFSILLVLLQLGKKNKKSVAQCKHFILSLPFFSTDFSATGFILHCMEGENPWRCLQRKVSFCNKLAFSYAHPPPPPPSSCHKQELHTDLVGEGFTFWVMWLIQGEEQLLRSGPWGSQIPSGARHRKVATPGKGKPLCSVLLITYLTSSDKDYGQRALLQVRQDKFPGSKKVKLDLNHWASTPSAGLAILPALPHH